MVLRRQWQQLHMSLPEQEESKALNVRLFRRNNRQSFSVQLSPTSGIVEVHCSRGISISACSDLGGCATARSALQHELEYVLLRLGRSEFGHLGGFSKDARERGGGWKVQLTRLGPYDLRVKGFVQCSIVFTKAHSDASVHPPASEGREGVAKRAEKQAGPGPASPQKKKTFFRWMMKR